MWSPNELLKTEKQRDILSYITLQFFPFKKVPLEHYPNCFVVCHSLYLPDRRRIRRVFRELRRTVQSSSCQPSQTGRPV